MTRITVRVTPRAARTAIHGWDGSVLTMRTMAPPVDGKANEAVTALLAKTLGIPKSRITLASGAKARTKVFQVEGLTSVEVAALLEAAAT